MITGELKSKIDSLWDISIMLSLFKEIDNSMHDILVLRYV